MRVLLSTYESHGDVEPMVGLAVQLRALGAEMPVCTAELVAAQFDTVPAAAAGPPGCWTPTGFDTPWRSSHTSSTCISTPPLP
ncbi:hypothetical protein BH18ACT11_BH18ACT11_28840 [soil metagenome]